MTLRESSAAHDLKISDLRFEHLREPFGIGGARPRLTWTIETSTRGWRQTAYEIKAERGDGQPRGGTGKVVSDQSVLVPWPFAPLASRERVVVRVRVWGAEGESSSWSAPATVEAGLLDPADWSAHFVTPDWDEDTSQPRPCPLLRQAFRV